MANQIYDRNISKAIRNMDMVSYNFSLRGAIQTHCATVDVDSTFEIWTPTPLC